MTLKPDVLRESLNVVVEKESAITPIFYQHLFRRYPQVKPLFGGKASDKQSRMLQEAIVAVVDHLEDGPWLTRTLEGMGRQHVGYGVTDEMYPWVKACLLDTLEEIAGDEWRPSYRGAWSDALDAVAGLMIAGASKERSETKRA